MTVEIDDDVRQGRGRVLENADEAGRARSLVFAKYAPRTGDDLNAWRDRALLVAIDSIRPDRRSARGAEGYWQGLPEAHRPLVA